jgi:hypothetical protein
MSRHSFVLLLVAALLTAGCETTASQKKVLPDLAVATVTATEEQILLGKTRATAMMSRWSAEETSKFKRSASPLLAVRTLGLTPEQSAAVEAQIPPGTPAVCVLLWNAREEKVVGSEIFVVTQPPERNQQARFSTYLARYMGSL